LWAASRRVPAIGLFKYASRVSSDCVSARAANTNVGHAHRSATMRTIIFLFEDMSNSREKRLRARKGIRAVGLTSREPVLSHTLLSGSRNLVKQLNKTTPHSGLALLLNQLANRDIRRRVERAHLQSRPRAR